MILHARTHENLDVEGCFGCRVASVSVAPSATPSRNRGAEAKATNEREQRWAKDHAAYKRMWNQGLSPKVLDGAADLESRAVNEADVELGLGMSEHVEIATDAA